VNSFGVWILTADGVLDGFRVQGRRTGRGRTVSCKGIKGPRLKKAIITIFEEKTKE
jgi:hypothetical protein